MFQLSVDFFFVLSGFVLTFSMRDRTPAVRSFAIKRVLRLVPVHYVCLAILLAIYEFSSTPLPYVPRPLPLSTVVADLALATPILWQTDAVNVPSWSVSWELYLPLIAVALAPYVSRLVARHSAAILAILCVGLSWTAVSVSSGSLLYGLRACLGLAAGACLFATSSRIRIVPRYARPAVLYALITLMFVIMLVAASLSIVAALFPWVTVATILVGARTRSLLSSRPAAWLGSISYTLYMVHVPVLVAMTAVFGSRMTASVGLKGGTIVAALAMASILTVAVERPAMMLAKRLRAGRRQEVAAVA
ncbi:acyltransferase [soil metagenome]